MFKPQIRFCLCPFRVRADEKMQKFNGNLSRALFEFEERITTGARELISSHETNGFAVVDFGENYFSEEDFFDSCHLLESGEVKKSVDCC